ncbi:MAG: 50S ribosomal protein L18 [Bacteroidales bacterium]|jgi:large subunit ribosomal protein L18|nr:50S ribosomal protein L18 [Bacteroidales bacterium]NLM91805.1 50S ribosomal protein L18 [Bacteroidales bacterium]
MATNKKLNRRTKIKYRIRKKVQGTSDRPRLTVFRSNKGIYAQVINDLEGRTLVSASSVSKELADKKITKSEMAKEVGKLLAGKAVEAGIEKVVFDRNGYLYHGRVKSLAEGAREGGLKF